MNTRRKFLLQGSMATTALLAAKPFTTFANKLAPVTGLTINDNKMVLVHSVHGLYDGPARQYVSDLKTTTGNMMLMHTGKADQPGYDVCIDTKFTADDYKILYKGNIKAGLITISAEDTNAVNKVNVLSQYLKNSKNCHIVICMSQLGYKNDTGMDDITLANASESVDIIIGAHKENFCKRPYIAMNKHKQEVIIHHSAGSDLLLGKIEIEFDKNGQKKKVGFNLKSN